MKAIVKNPLQQLLALCLAVAILAATPDSTLYAAWQDWTPGVFEVYALRWLGE